jgi:phosphatidylglycerol:prolipoprotein diacylglycerol transferase
VIAFFLPGGIAVYAFTILVGLGSVIGLGWAEWLASKDLKPYLVDAGICVLVGALVGSRVGYVAVNWGYFNQHLPEIPQVQSGGLTWAGAIVGSLISLALYSQFKHVLLGELADALLPLALALSISIWLGSWLDGCFYGNLTNSWWGIPARDEWGVLSKRFPLQFTGALIIMGTFWLLDKSLDWKWISSRVSQLGRVSLLAWLSLSLELFGLSFLRADPAPVWKGLRLDSWAGLGSASIALIWLLILYIRSILKTHIISTLEQREEEK